MFKALKLTTVTLFFFLTFFLSSSQSASAQVCNPNDYSCGSLTVSPSSGESDTVFTVTTILCEPEGEWGWISFVDGNPVASGGFSTNSSNAVEVFISSLTQTGVHTIKFWPHWCPYGDGNPPAGQVTVTVGEVVNVACGNLVAVNFDTCPDDTPQSDCCPASCPAIPLSADTWICGESTMARCGDTGIIDPNLCPTICPAEEDGSGTYTCVYDAPPIFSRDFKICQQAGNIGSTYYSKCCNCLTGNPDCDDNLNQRGIWTAIGCINFQNANNIAVSIIRFATGVSGGFTLLFILFGSFLITTSAGNPEKLKTGQQTITSAIIGLVFILFSVTLLKFIGVEIISIPGF